MKTIRAELLMTQSSQFSSAFRDTYYVSEIKSSENLSAQVSFTIKFWTPCQTCLSKSSK